MIYVTVEIGKGDFKGVGTEFLQYFRTLGNIAPNDRVLEVGCGIGRMAVPLTKFLSSQGSYDGIDISKVGINWCLKNITSQYPNFRFQVADVFNEHYNPQGATKASDYRFPYEDGFFDFAFATSLFTHMITEDTKNYLREIFRVLKDGAKSLITYFTINTESLETIRVKEVPLELKKLPFQGCYTANPDDPEAFIGYDEQYIREMYREIGFSLVEPIQYGSWCGREDFVSDQDIVLAKKP